MKNPKISVIVVYSAFTDGIESFVKNLENQTYKDFEAIFVNCNSDERTIELLSNSIQKIDKFIMITLPNNQDYEFAKNSGLDLASGDYVCFLDINENLDEEFVANIYYSSLKKEKGRIKTENNRLYKRSFIDNNADINDIIKAGIDVELKKINLTLDETRNYFQLQIDNCYKNADNNVNNKVYDLSLRCNVLEKLIYGKENGLDIKLKEFFDKIQEQMTENNNSVNADIRKNHEDFSAQIAEKFVQTEKQTENRIENYQNKTEKIIEENHKEINSEIVLINQKIEDLYKEQEIRYNNLKNMLELLKEELNDKIKAISLMPVSDNLDKINKTADLINFENNMNQNFDKIYSYINSQNIRFYKELTDFYKEVAEKIKK